jgi:hypothetical protein
VDERREKEGGRVTLTWPWAEESEGEKEKGARSGGRLLLKRRWGRQGRSGGPGCGAAWAGMARTRRLRAAPTTAGGARLVDAVGALRIGEAAGCERRWRDS